MNQGPYGGGQAHARTPAPACSARARHLNRGRRHGATDAGPGRAALRTEQLAAASQRFNVLATQAQTLQARLWDNPLIERGAKHPQF